MHWKACMFYNLIRKRLKFTIPLPKLAVVLVHKLQLVEINKQSFTNDLHWYHKICIWSYCIAETSFLEGYTTAEASIPQRIFLPDFSQIYKFLPHFCYFSFLWPLLYMQNCNRKLLISRTPTKAKSQEPAYSQALNQNKVDRQRSRSKQLFGNTNYLSYKRSLNYSLRVSKPQFLTKSCASLLDYPGKHKVSYVFQTSSFLYRNVSHHWQKSSYTAHLYTRFLRTGSPYWPKPEVRNCRNVPDVFVSILKALSY